MARKNTSIQKPKEPVRIRTKQLRNGNKSLYLDIYEDGRRRYEFLKLYLIPEHTPFDKAQNANIIQVANAIKAQRIIDIANGKAGIKSTDKNLLLADWVRHIGESNEIAHTTRGQYRLTAQIIEEYAPNVRLCKVDKDFCRGFVDFVLHKHISSRGKTLHGTTARIYISKLKHSLSSAVAHEKIPFNPFDGVEVRTRDKVRELCFLSSEELKRMIETPYREDIKNPYLFSCYCGLRLSDIEKLCWSDIVEEEGVTWCNVRMKKTQNYLRLPLSDAAVRWLPKRQERGLVFPPVERSSRARHLLKWASLAGVEKHITSHTGRHTFATLALTKGADIYTVSKLLGHSDIKTTQIYAKIVDEKKVEAVNLLNEI